MVGLLLAIALFWTPGRAARARIQVSNWARSQTSEESASNCADILKDGIRDLVKNDLKTHDQYEAEEMIKQFNESYSYDDYKRDHRNSQASSSSQSSQTEVGVSYGLFSAGVSHGQSSSESMMTEAEFNNRKQRIQQQKAALEQSSSSSGASSESMNFASQIVSSEISSAWKDCMKFAQSQIETVVSKEVTGRTLNIGLKHSLGTGPEPKIPPMIVKVEVTPHVAGMCEVTNGEGQIMAQLPITFHIGIPIHISCHRNAGYTDTASVYVATNVVKEGMRAYFNDVTTPQMAEELAKLESSIDQKFGDVDMEISDAKSAMDSQIRTAMASVNSISSKISTAESSVASVQNELGQTQTNADEVRRKLKDGVCRLCYTCGGHFNNQGGTFPNGGYDEYGSGCGGQKESKTDNPRLCCLSQ